ncbi:hypothetical protein SAMN02745165_00120 [Malonomonas rubra DSM 5091]|uniref:Uncharacterized protein n=1 Tax=Malonomonas rubra DSM 5091 TaxID=1122189 RepID=A0A1M6BCJ3_MALRU|nr:hypothetical protein [Malonomonas rubra]SHI46439.1 hypothetical protein SAMN02745165_00120 [Malonomonas rubra DSM 5091]
MSRARLLLLLLILLGFAGWYAWQQTPRQKRVVGKTEALSVKSFAAEKSKEGNALDFSGGEASSFRKPKRDLFGTIYPAPPIKKLPPSKPQPKPVITPVPKPQPKPVITPVEPAVKPIQPLTVLGYLQKDRERTVFLASRQGEVFLVKQGVRFADDLLVQKIDATSIHIGRNEIDKGVTLQVAESKKQRMAIQNVSSGRPSVPEYTSPAPTQEQPAVLPGQN